MVIRTGGCWYGGIHGDITECDGGHVAVVRGSDQQSLDVRQDLHKRLPCRVVVTLHVSERALKYHVEGKALGNWVHHNI